MATAGSDVRCSLCGSGWAEVGPLCYSCFETGHESPVGACSPSPVLNSTPPAAPLSPPACADLDGPPVNPDSTRAAGGIFPHGERCDCPSCRLRYRQGRSLESVDASGTAAGWALVLGFLLVAGMVAAIAILA